MKNYYKINRLYRALLHLHGLVCPGNTDTRDRYETLRVVKADLDAACLEARSAMDEARSAFKGGPMITTPKEAIEEAMERGGLWFRPKKWAGSGQALTEDLNRNLRLVVVPSLKGGMDWTPSADELMCSWEVVHPDVVSEENCRIQASKSGCWESCATREANRKLSPPTRFCGGVCRGCICWLKDLSKCSQGLVNYY